MLACTCPPHLSRTLLPLTLAKEALRVFGRTEEGGREEKLSRMDPPGGHRAYNEREKNQFSQNCLKEWRSIL